MGIKLHWYAPKATRKAAWRRWLNRIGPSWAASPVRRFVQAAFFALFLILFFYVAWPFAKSGTADFADIRQRKEFLDIEFFLALDPLVSASAAIAARAWVWSLWFAIAIIAVGLILPRAFCGYLCPMGTLIDLSDWVIGKRFKRFHLRHPGWWRHSRYFILAAVLASAAFGVILTGYVAAIPVITRGFEFTLAPLQSGLSRGWQTVAPLQTRHWISIALFITIPLLGLLRPRFWCRHLCPSGAFFSLFNFFRITERKTQPHCIQCGKCAKECAFDAINDDFTTVPSNCTFCQTCGGVCPVDAIHFTHRLASTPLTIGATEPAGKQEIAVDYSRRGFIIGTTAGLVAGGLAARCVHATKSNSILRPPGSALERDFTRLCVRCDQCLRVCPTGILQPASLEHGFNNLWTPWANADFAGCDPNCNNCGQVCPTGAIRALTLEQKRQTRMGLAQINAATCLQFKGRADCETSAGASVLCRDVCEAARYAAISTEEGGADGGHPVPNVNPETCVGCGLCQAVCYSTNVLEKKLLPAAAIRVEPAAAAPARATATPATQPATSTAPTVEVPYTVPD